MGSKNDPDSGIDNLPEMTTLEWVELQNTIDQMEGGPVETFLQKAKRRTIENPIAPIGLLIILTIFFHYY